MKKPFPGRPWRISIWSQHGTIDSVSSSEIPDEFIIYGKSWMNPTGNIYKSLKRLNSMASRFFHKVYRNTLFCLLNTTITIEYGTNELNWLNVVEYQYKLDGYDQDWVGPYKEVVRPMEHQGRNVHLLCKNGITRSWGWWCRFVDRSGLYSFTVLPPWYHNRLAYLVYVFLSYWGWQVHLWEKEPSG